MTAGLIAWLGAKVRMGSLTGTVVGIRTTDEVTIDWGDNEPDEENVYLDDFAELGIERTDVAP